jgi:hypothetical protein
MQITAVPHAQAYSPAPSARVSPTQVSAALLQRADGDGDGRTGASALNDGDAAAHAAAQQVKTAPGRIDVRV